MNKPSFSARVLLVDDDKQQLELRASILVMAGYSVLTAEEPLQALSLATTLSELDIAIIDYEMPAMNGGVLAEHLRATFPKLNLVLYSGAIEIPLRDLKNVDTFISKCEGVAVLLQHLRDLSSPIKTTPSTDAKGQNKSTEAEPGLGGTERSVLPTVLAVSSAT